MLLLPLIFTSVLALIDNPCYVDLRIEKVSDVGVSGEYGKYSNITKNCNNGIKNEEDVYSTSSKSRCWIHADTFQQIVGGNSINRCGICFALHGPSMNTYYCSVVGAFETNVTTATDIKKTRKLLFVDEQLYELVTGYSGDKSLSFKVNINLVQCPYSVYPAAIVTDISPSEEDPSTSIASINLINTNVLVKKISFNNETYFADSDTCLYYVPVSTNGILKLYNIMGQATIIKFDFNSTSMQIANSPLSSPLKENTDCDYRISLNIAGLETPEDDFLKWTFRFSNDTNLTNGVILSNDLPEFDIQPLSFGFMSFTYPTPFIASKLFGFFYMEVEVSHTIGLPFPVFYSMYGDDFNDATPFSFSKSIVLNYHDTDLENGYIQRIANVSVRISGANGYSNVWMLRYYNSQNITQHWIIRKMFLTDSTERTYYQCNVNNYACSVESECDPTGSTIIPDDGDEIVEYETGCVPYCGECRSGYVCNQAAKCVKQQNYNSRSGSILPFMLLAINIILIL
ncbi:Uncharacterized protein QTN25_007855 [Entamoeba marina]